MPTSRLVSALLVGAVALNCAASPARTDPPPVGAAADAAASAAHSDRVCERFSASAVDAGFADVTAFALTTRVTCVVSHGDLACVDLFGSAPRTFAKGVVAVGGGQRIVALLEGGSLVMSPMMDDFEGPTLDVRAVHQALAAWGKTPSTLTYFASALTLFDEGGESRRFLMLRDATSELAVARERSFDRIRQATVSHSSFFTEYECVLVGDGEQCRLTHARFAPVRHGKRVKAIGGNAEMSRSPPLLPANVGESMLDGDAFAKAVSPCRSSDQLAKTS